MRCLLTIADDSGLDVYAISGNSLVKHWYLSNYNTLTFIDIIEELSSQVAWVDYKVLNCDLSCHNGENACFKGIHRTDPHHLWSSFEFINGPLLIETRAKFIIFNGLGYSYCMKSDIYDEPANFLADVAYRKYAEIGCKVSAPGSVPYENTKFFFKNLMEHMPEEINIILVPIFASSGSSPLSSDREFVELSMDDSVENASVGHLLKAKLRTKLNEYFREADVVWIYNSFLKKNCLYDCAGI